MNEYSNFQTNKSSYIDMSVNQLEFSVFCIENVGLKLGLMGDKVYELLTKNSKLLYEYIIPFYDVLHSQSKEYIVDDIIGIMKERGII